MGLDGLVHRGCGTRLSLLMRGEIENRGWRYSVAVSDVGEGLGGIVGVGVVGGKAAAIASAAFFGMHAAPIVVPMVFGAVAACAIRDYGDSKLVSRNPLLSCASDVLLYPQYVGAFIGFTAGAALGALVGVCTN